MSSEHRAVFLDKDGTLLVDVAYNVDPARMQLQPDAVAGLKRLAAAGYRLIVISNQAGVAHGYFSEDALQTVKERLAELLGEHEIEMEDFYYCPHHPAGVVKAYARACECRKPEPGLILRAAREHSIDMSNSFFIGDILDDVQAGHRAGCRSILIDNGNETEWELDAERTPDYRATNLNDAANWILTSEEEIDRTCSSACLTADERSIARDHLAEVIAQFRKLRVLVLGDAMLDIYSQGTMQRICSEAPAPVVDIKEQQCYAGGAANTAANLVDLGAAVSFLTVIGHDCESDQLLRLLQGRGIETSLVRQTDHRRALVKHRVFADHQMVARMDLGTTAPLDAASEDHVVKALENWDERFDALVVSDYGYGTLTPRVIASLKQPREGRLLAVDSKRLRAFAPLQPDLVKPNCREALALLDLEPVGECDERVETIARSAGRLTALTGARVVAVTVDRDGCLCIERGHSPIRIDSAARAARQVAGAGDTFVSVFSLSLAAGSSAPQAAHLANIAASIVVEKERTATCSAAELLERISPERGALVELPHLARLLETHRQQGLKIVMTNGCFDILHKGHVTYLRRARELGDVLVVGLNSDESIRRLKGPMRPINSLADRAGVLAGLDCIDYLISFDDDTPHRLIEAIRPNIFVKGGDYTRETLPEAELVERLGGIVQILPMVAERSTTSLINRIRRGAEPAAASLFVSPRNEHVSRTVGQRPERLVR